MQDILYFKNLLFYLFVNLFSFFNLCDSELLLNKK
jgi:hypothetical protein